MGRFLHSIVFFWLSFFVFFSTCTFVAPVSAYQEPDPTEQLRPFISKVVAILTDENLALESNRSERRALVLAASHERFDFHEMSQKVLGEEWNKLTGQEQKEFVDMFIKILEHAYTTKIEGYSRQKVVYEGQRIKGDRALVNTVLVENDVSLPVSYVMILKDKEWMVYDVVVDGVSLVRNYQDQFSQILKEEGYTGLMKRLEEKVAELKTE